MYMIKKVTYIYICHCFFGYNKTYYIQGPFIIIIIIIMVVYYEMTERN